MPHARNGCARGGLKPQQHDDYPESETPESRTRRNRTRPPAHGGKAASGRRITGRTGHPVLPRDGTRTILGPDASPEERSDLLSQIRPLQSGGSRLLSTGSEDPVPQSAADETPGV